MTRAHVEYLARRAGHSAMKRNSQSRETLHISDENAEKLKVKNINFVVAIAQLKMQIENHTAF